MQQPDQNKLDAFLSKMVGDLGSVATGALVVCWAIGLVSTRQCSPAKE